MTSTQQFDELKRRIWQIANDVRGTEDGWDFKQYVLGALFYRFISENFARYIEAIMKLFDEKENVAHVAQSVRMEAIAENDYNLCVSSYVEAEDTREIVNITELNAEIASTVSNIDGLRNDIVAEIDLPVGRQEGVRYE